MGGSEGDVCIGRKRIECRAVLEDAAAAAATSEGGVTLLIYNTFRAAIMSALALTRDGRTVVRLVDSSLARETR